MSDAIVLHSGGLDSATTLAIAKGEGFSCHCLSFDYGQRHRAELDAAKRVAESLGAASHRTIALDLRAFGGSALTADIDVPKARPEEEIASGIPVTYVPARNLVFLSLATAMAEAMGAGEVFIGVNAVDFSGYPDCRPAFVRSFEQTAKLATRAGVEGGRLAIRTPLMDLSKAEIIRQGYALGVDFGLTVSCYDPVETGGGPLACGACDACVLRRRGFFQAGVSDPTRYAG